MAEYTLYIDESETFNSAGDKYFVMSGVIIKDSNYSDIENVLNKAKQIVWEIFRGVRGTYYMKKISALQAIA